MLNSVFSRLTYANVIATLALFVALGGTAAAGAHAWVTGAAVRDGSLRPADFNASDLKAMVGAAGATGPAGPAGPAGAKGDEGKRGDPGEGILHVSASGADATNYVNDDVLVSQTLPADGGWLGWAQL